MRELISNRPLKSIYKTLYTIVNPFTFNSYILENERLTMLQKFDKIITRIYVYISTKIRKSNSMWSIAIIIDNDHVSWNINDFFEEKQWY